MTPSSRSASERTRFAFLIIGKIYNGLLKIDFNDFERIMSKELTIGSPPIPYPFMEWNKFCKDRVGYCLSRNPEELGYALFERAFHLETATETKKEKEEDHGKQGKEEGQYW